VFSGKFRFEVTCNGIAKRVTGAKVPSHLTGSSASYLRHAPPAIGQQMNMVVSKSKPLPCLRLEDEGLLTLKHLHNFSGERVAVF
jgi:hypothetical protein